MTLIGGRDLVRAGGGTGDPNSAPVPPGVEQPLDQQPVGSLERDQRDAQSHHSGQQIMDQRRVGLLVKLCWSADVERAPLLGSPV